MSDNMEREKNERLIEQEKMKKQLEALGIYDETDTFEQMKTLLGFLNNSETTPNIATDNKHTQKKDNEQHSDNECLSELTSEIDAPQEQQTVVAQELSKVTYKQNRTSPTVAQQERKSSRHSSSPESSSTNSSIFNARSPGTQGRKSAENDDTTPSEKQQQQQQHEQSVGANRSIPSKPGNGTQECQNSPTNAKTMQCATQSSYYQRQERWRMNPFDVCINENDVPLQQPRSRLSARKYAPSSGCHNKTYTSEQHDQKMRALGQHLREMADLWYSWQRPANAKFEWGVPIEVGTANGNLDRKPVTEPKTEPIKAEYAHRDNYERSSKRKANSLIAKECADLNKESSSDEDDQYEFARVKKKKIQSDDKSSNVVDSANQQHVQTPSRHEAVTLIARQQYSHNDDDAHIDDEDTRSPHRRKTENEENERVSPVLIAQSKKAISSTPKSRPNISRCRRGRLSLKIQRIDENGEMERTRNQNKDNVITDEEIRRKLEEDSDGEEVEAILRKDMETRSSKETKSQLQERRLLFNNTEILREPLATYKERENDKQQDSEEKKIDLGEQRKKDKCEEDKSMSWEHQLLDDDDDDEIKQPTSQNGNWREKVTDSTNNINCPICNKSFPPDEIENHAAYCDQFETNDEEDDDDINQFKCNICDNYKTRNGLDYKQHVKRCIESRKEAKHLYGSDDVDIVPIPSSHHKASEQKAASSSPKIDPMDQSSSHSRTRVFTNRKRKH